jgi:G3E family GTPase
VTSLSYRFCFVSPGLASPGPIASALWTDPELEADVCLDAILTVCDATNIQRQLADEREDGAINEAQEQIAYADIILCNKVLMLSIIQRQQSRMCF